MEPGKQDAKDRDAVGAAGRRKMLAYRKLRLREGDNERRRRGTETKRRDETRRDTG